MFYFFLTLYKTYDSIHQKKEYTMEFKGKCSYQNLGLIITNKCNLDCKHCCRGCKDNKDMSKEIIDRVLSQVVGASNLAICGGEATLALPILEYIINYVVDNHIFIDELTFVINGTIYSTEMLRMLDYLNEYIQQYRKKDESTTTFTISYDKYHLEEIVRLGLLEEYKENVRHYRESIHFYGYQILKPNKKLFREGNACYLDQKITVPLYQMKYFVSYAGKGGKLDMENGLCNIGPLVTINPDGILTEADSSIENQETIYNYGNVFDDSLEELILKRAKVLKPKKWYKACCKESDKYSKYNRL